MTRAERRRARYLRDKLNGICVACRRWLPDSWSLVQCASCSARQLAWQQAHRAQRSETERRRRARSAP